MMGIGLVLLGIFILFWFMVLANSDSVMIDFNRTLDDDLRRAGIRERRAYSRKSRSGIRPLARAGGD